MNETEKEFECPVCLDYMLEEICMCNNGHNICRYCKDSMTAKRCPICRASFIEGRNFALEKVIKNTHLRCRNEGCRLRLPGKYMKQHYLECVYGKTACILYNTGCRWRGNLSALKNHITKKHKNSINRWLDHGSYYSYLIFRFGDLFIIYLKNEDDCQKAAGMKMGFTKWEARHYKFMLEYEDDENVGYELTLAAPCIEKCYFDEIFQSDYVEASHKMIRRLQHELDIHIKVKVDRWENPIE